MKQNKAHKSAPRNNIIKRLSATLAVCFAMASAPLTPLYAQNAATPAPAATQDVRAVNPQDIALASEPYLAYIMTGDGTRDSMAQAGLEALAQTLTNRTSIEPAGVIAINIENDDISLLPFIYWSISADDTPLSETARLKLQRYIDNGGMVLFDVHGLRGNMVSTQAIAQVAGRLSIRPVEDLPQDHTLTRSFYLLTHLRGSYNYDDVLVEQQGTPGTESVSNVIIGENDWVSAWAGRTVRSGSDEYEMALRAGVNMLMYALTGDYKSDQMQIDNTINRLSR